MAQCQCLLWVVRIMLCWCSAGTFESFRWHFTPHNRYRNMSYLPSQRPQGDTRTTYSTQSPGSPLYTGIEQGGVSGRVSKHDSTQLTPCIQRTFERLGGMITAYRRYDYCLPTVRLLITKRGMPQEGSFLGTSIKLVLLNKTTKPPLVQRWLVIFGAFSSFRE